MKITSQYQRTSYDKSGKAEVTFRINNFRQIALLDELEQDVNYTLEIKRSRSKRSVEQNRYMWALLNALEEYSDMGMMTWYHHALEQADAKHEYLLGSDELMTTLVHLFRAVKPVGKRMVNDKEVTIYKCYLGSSKMNTK